MSLASAIGTTFHALARQQALDVLRDPLLRWMVVIPPLYALAVRWVVPVIEARTGFELAEPYGVLITSVLLVAIAPIFLGFVVGMQLLDERDGGTLLAIRVTPLTLDGYVAWKFAVPLLLCTAQGWVMVPLAGLIAWRPDQLVVAFAAMPGCRCRVSS
jgi:hypothetical protein